ncbi:MAG: hypothetical protein VCD00_19575 [Candidatus Hydrogenedentota bacterium]
MVQRIATLILSLFLVVAILAVPPAHAAPHPMDPLSNDEIEDALQLLVQSGNLQSDSRMAYMRLYDMDKADVLAWKPGAPITRTVETFVSQSNGFFKARISLDTKSLLSWEAVDSGQAPLTGSDFMQTMAILNNSKPWKDALAKRGLKEPKKVIAVTFSVGYFGDPAQKNQRLNRVGAYYPADVENLWGRPIGGLSALVDVKGKKVIEVIDTGVVPISTGSVEYSNKAVGTQSDPVNRISYSQPGGASYTINDHMLKWQKWEMHYRIDPQVGMVLSNITYDDRSVLYQASVSELFVPYMDPSPGWYSRTFIDAGEFGLGNTLTPIIRGAECPENSTLLSATLAGINGKPQTFQNVIAIFERYTGDPAWRHADPIVRTMETRADQEFVVRTIATVGNYDYIFDWVFNQNGTIHVKTGATGIVSSKAVSSRTAREAGRSEETRYGRFVDEHIIAVNHDHYVVYRLDFDVDGTTNDFVKDVITPVKFPPEHPRRSGWEVITQIAQTEQDVKLRVNFEKPSVWRIRSSERKNSWGYPTSFMIKPGSPHISLQPDDDWPQKRAGFSKYTMWLTAYDRDELYAAGAFPNQSDGRGGLSNWVKANRDVRDADVVVWYTLGFHHVVHAEDWPIMPVEWFSFCIKPFDFMDENPVMNIPGPE